MDLFGQSIQLRPGLIGKIVFLERGHICVHRQSRGCCATHDSQTLLATTGSENSVIDVLRDR